MRTKPSLVPISPSPGDPVTVDRSPFWIGSSATAQLKVFVPGVAERHASITEREDGFYVGPWSAATPLSLGGRVVTEPTRLRDGDIVSLGLAARFEWVTGEARQVAAPVVPVPEPPPEDRRRPWWKPRRARHRGVRGGFPVWAWVVALGLGAAMLGVGIKVYRLIASVTTEPLPPPALNAFEGQLYDSMLVEATAHIERGATLIDLGARDAGARELAAAITTFDQSVLRTNPWVQQGVDALRRTVEDIYRANRIALPAGFSRAPRRAPNLSANLSSNLNPDEFLRGVDAVRSAYRDSYRDTVVVTGRDHPEHLSLYGARSAMDIRVRGLRPDQVRFLIDGFAARGIRVKDFSSDQVLRAQIQAAIRAGVPDRAGTGIHLHIDRYQDRSDRWTVRR